MSDPLGRFSTRVENYIKFRPGYPSQVVDLLQRECELTPGSVIADIGSGTGILSELFLKNGNRVFGVEPNAEMRAAAEDLLKNYQRFMSVDAKAEQTDLPSESVDFVMAGQAFHWFDAQRARAEFRRILRADGWVVLIWNERRLDSSPFHSAYEELLLRWGMDYQKVRHENTTRDIHQFFAPESHKLAKIENLQQFDLEGLQGRVFSASYTPEPGHPNFEPMLVDLRSLFSEHAKNGKIVFEYDTTVYYGHLTSQSE